MVATLLHLPYCYTYAHVTPRVNKLLLLLLLFTLLWHQINYDLILKLSVDGKLENKWRTCWAVYVDITFNTTSLSIISSGTGECKKICPRSVDWSKHTPFFKIVSLQFEYFLKYE